MFIEYDTLRDSKMRWDNCVVLAQGKLLLVQEIRDLSSETLVMSGVLRSEEGWIPTRSSIPLSEIDTTHPDTGYFNHGKNAYRLIKKARDRQYKLGFCGSRYSCIAPNSEENYLIGGLAEIDVMGCLDSIYYRSYVTPSAAILGILSKGVFSAAVSRTVALGVSSKCRGIGVYRNNKLIGEVDETMKASIPYKHRYFTDELVELGFSIELIENKHAKETE